MGIKNTKTRILDAAEILFTEHGLRETSLRHITSQAGVNISAVNYHFGSREALIEAVFARRVVPMNEARIARLETQEARFPDSGIPVEKLVEAFCAPALMLSRDMDHGGALFIRLMGRAYAEPNAALHQSLRRLFTPVIERFRPAFVEALPTLPAEELYWRMHFMVGLLAYLMSGTEMMRLIASSDLSDPLDADALLKRLVGFVCGGFHASPPDLTNNSKPGIYRQGAHRLHVVPDPSPTDRGKPS